MSQDETIDRSIDMPVESTASDRLLKTLYDELRKLAAAKLNHEKPGQTLQATALVHEAYLKLTEGKREARWESRGHFFAAAAEAMRRILVDQARRKGRLKHGGDWQRVELDDVEMYVVDPKEDVEALDRALEKLKLEDATAAELVQLRYFTGLPIQDVATIMDISTRTANRIWVFARAWLYREMQQA